MRNTHQVRILAILVDPVSIKLIIKVISTNTSESMRLIGKINRVISVEKRSPHFTDWLDTVVNFIHGKSYKYACTF